MKLELRSVRIKNIGPIDDIKIDFFDTEGKTLPVCVIGGANGSGKTTLLEVIISLAEILQTGRPGAFFESKPDGYAQADCLIDDHDFSFFFGTLPGDEVLKKEHCGLKVVTHSPKGIQLVGVGTSLYTEIQQRIRDQQNSPVSHRFPANGSVPSLIYLPHSRSLEPVSGQQIQKENGSYSFIHRFQTVRKFPGSLTSYLIYLDYAEPDQFSDVRQFLNGLGFDGKTFDIDRKKLDVIVKTANGHEHSLHELSSGEQN
ncbi:MAG: AAA family ATPase, partial [Blastocatellia bacterium]